MTLYIAIIFIFSLSTVINTGHYLFFAAAVCLFEISRRNSYGLIMSMFVLTYFPLLSFNVNKVFIILFGVSLLGSIVGSHFEYRLRGFSLKLNIIALFFLSSMLLGNMLNPYSSSLALIGNYVEVFVLMLVVMQLKIDAQDLIRVFNRISILVSSLCLLMVVHVLFRQEMYLTRIYASTFPSINMPIETRYSLMYGSTWLADRLLFPGEDPNYWAAFLFLPMSVSLSAALHSLGKGMKLLHVTAFICSVVMLFGTYSRSSYISLVLFGFFYLLSYRRGTLKFAILASFGLTIALRFLPLFWLRLLSIGSNLQVHGGSGRFNLWEMSIKEFIANPIFGNGMGSFVHKYGVAVHNTFLQLLSDGGIFALICFLLLLVFPVLTFRRNVYTAGDFKLKKVFSLLLISYVVLLFHATTISIHKPMVMFQPIILMYLLTKRERGS